MIYGLYLSAQGAEVQSVRQDVIANNLANASTTSFKRDLALFQSHPPFDKVEGVERDLPGQLNRSTGGTSLAGIATDFANGAQIATGGKLDIALTGPGFFRVTDGKQQFLTRNGQLTIDPRGRLVTSDRGLTVQGVKPIPPGTLELEFSEDGNVFAIDAERQRVDLGRLDLVHPATTGELQKQGDSLYRTTGQVFPAGAEVRVKQGYLEASGTNSVAEMMELIEAARAFESNINMIKFQDEALGQLIQSVPRR
jgi:flagellar basal-body rod protein FlgF